MRDAAEKGLYRVPDRIHCLVDIEAVSGVGRVRREVGTTGSGGEEEEIIFWATQKNVSRFFILFYTHSITI